MTSLVAHVDFETFSECDLRAAGAYAYAMHPSTDILCMAWAIGDGEVHLWKPGDRFPVELKDHIVRVGTMVAWNAPFERLIWWHVAQRRYGFPAVPDEQWWCAAAQGANMALPRDLDGAASALGGAQQKDPEGRRIMLQLSKPRKPTTNDPRTRWTPEMAPEKFAKLYAYCQQDVRAERGICERLYGISDSERRLYLLDQKINDRGVRIDRPLIEAAKAIVEQTLGGLDMQLRDVTGGAVQATTQVAALTRWVAAQGVPCDSLASAELEAMLERPGLPWPVEKALLIRQEAAKSSTAKLDAMLTAAGPDDRIRGSLLYYGAARTGRWAGRLHQPQNFPRGDEAILEDVDGAVAAIATGNAGYVRSLYGSPMTVVSTCLRPMMIAAEDHDLIACDFANIEGRVLAWLGGEEWKLKAFREYDAGTGPDLYKVTYGKTFNVDPNSISKKDPRRQQGKVIDLAGGFGGWVGACQAFSKLYRVKWSDDEAAVAMGAYRDAHPATRRLWESLNDAAFRAVASPGRKFRAGSITYLCSGDYLWCRLPSARVLAYCRPTIEKNDRGEDAVHFWGVDSYTKRWTKQGMWGGLLAENVTQAVARDLLAEAMLRLEAAGYPLVLTVHDELVAEAPKGFGSVEEMEQIAAVLPDWASGLPVTASGWRGERYRK